MMSQTFAFAPKVSCAENGQMGRKSETWILTFWFKYNNFRISTQPIRPKGQHPRVHQVCLADPPGSPPPTCPMAAHGTKARSFNSPSVPQALLFTTGFMNQDATQFIPLPGSQNPFGGEPSTVPRPLSYIFHMILDFSPLSTVGPA